MACGKVEIPKQLSFYYGFPLIPNSTYSRFDLCTNNSCLTNWFSQLSCESLQLLQSSHGPLGRFSPFPSDQVDVYVFVSDIYLFPIHPSLHRGRVGMHPEQVASTSPALFSFYLKIIYYLVLVYSKSPRGMNTLIRHCVSSTISSCARLW